MRMRITKGAIYLGVWIISFGLSVRTLGLRPQPEVLWVAALSFLLVKLASALSRGSFRELWRHTGLEDLGALVESTALTSAFLAAMLALVPELGLAPHLAVVDGGFTLLLLGPLRISPRIIRELVGPRLAASRRPVVLAGRADRVDLELRRMLGNARADRVVGLVIDGLVQAGDRVHQVPVVAISELASFARRRGVTEVLVVPPSSASFQARLETTCAEAGLRCRQVASLLTLAHLVQGPEVLLDRPSVLLDPEPLERALSGRRVLITGAGGSIGSELARQVLQLAPAELTLVDRNETPLFAIEQDLLGRHSGVPLCARLVDVRDAAAVQRLFAAQRPQVVLHAAAHKHVPLMERHPSEAVLNNVLGTRNVLEASIGFGVQGVVFVSTDKAVRPRSVMGATKRVGELMVRSLAACARTRFISVRFGNVLGSSGSVLPIFVDQIQRGGPVTVTHPEMRRFFMSIPEACQLVLHAAALGEGGELFVLDMGEPVRILDLARRIIERAGLRPGDDVPIVLCGERPGEKLVEELVMSVERPAPTGCPGLSRVTDDPIAWEDLERELGLLEAVARAGDDRATLAQLRQLVPGFEPEALGYEAPLKEAEAG